MKFYSKAYPSLGFYLNGIHTQFKNGEYETDIEEEIEQIKKLKSVTYTEEVETPNNQVPPDFDDITVDELEVIAKEKEIKGYSKMNKGELYNIIFGG